ncbi:hypothetical protein GGI25_004154 [Coemansia spiralis]|uniref:Endopeptidase S2P n=1 Tax=Coemansia spiralis TaxID=417178 RepID=A0A9W8G0W3_9FUNG|nr:hypothetical protein BX070DRAFT_230709 [Coemansia spiralis]KAJ2675006.1 hypothetical protein GGI25_004154 [Coemansia spiralis]
MEGTQLPLLPCLYFLGLWALLNLAFYISKRVRASSATQQTRMELVSPLHLRFTTTVGWVHRLGALWWPPPWFYDLGIVCTFASMTLCTLFLLIAGAQILLALMGRLGLCCVEPTAGGPMWLRPVIPGVTLPNGHIWYYLLSLLFCAVVHELGHAFTAARASITVHSAGLFVIGLYPGAFVDLQKTELDRRPIREQLRVVCAGVWHNAVTALIAWLLMHSGLLLVLEHAGWSQIPDGVAVMDVAKQSPLHTTIPVFSTVYRVDDVWLAPADDGFGSSPIQRWTSVLMNSGTESLGFCASPRENLDDGLCCEMSQEFPLGESPHNDLFCFEHAASNNATMCFIIGDVLVRSRCSVDVDCNKGLMCVRPRAPFPTDSRVVRIYHRLSGRSKMAIYQGSPTRLWLDVSVSVLSPRWPYRLPIWSEHLVQYVLSFSLAFCLLNSLPAWHLDGDHALRLLLSNTVAGDCSLSLSGQAPDSVQSAPALGPVGLRIHSTTTAVATVLLGWCIVGSLGLLVL